MVVVAGIFVALFTGRCGKSTSRPLGFDSFGAPITSQGAYPTTSFAGVIDPTNPTFAGGMVACNSSCSGGLIEQNRAALQAAIDFAKSNNRRVHVPASATRYPLGLKSGQTYSIDLSGDSKVTIDAYGATFAMYGDAAAGAAVTFMIRNTSNVIINGATFSQANLTNASAASAMVQVGDGGSTSVDNIELNDVVFEVGAAGDCMRLDGGGSSVTVTRIVVFKSRFEGCTRAGLEVKPGVQRVSATFNWFKNNGSRDIFFEAAADNTIGQFTLIGNTMERSGGSTTPSVTISGNGTNTTADQSIVKYNKIIGGTLEGVHLSHAAIDSNSIVYDQAAGGTANIEISGKSSDVWIVDNYLFRGLSASAGSLIKTAQVSTNGPINLTIRGNRIYQATGISPAIDLSGSQRSTVVDNDITYHSATADSGATGFSGIYCAGGADVICSAELARNAVKRDDQLIHASLSLNTTTLHCTTIVEAISSGTPSNGITLAFVGDSGVNAGTLAESGGGRVVTFHFKPAVTTVANFETALNSASLVRVKTVGAVATLTTGAGPGAGDVFSATALTGAAQAGRMLAGVKFMIGSQTVVNRLTLRDNVVDGAAAAYYMDADGLAAWPEGVPVVSGNFPLNVAAHFAGGITTWRTESTLVAETKTSGALGVTMAVDFLSTANTQSYTQADAVVDGFAHCYKITAVSGVPVGMLSFASSHLFEGTTHTISWVAAGENFCLLWDATVTKYRVLSKSSGITVN